MKCYAGKSPDVASVVIYRYINGTTRLDRPKYVVNNANPLPKS